jgi:hypothetical protein
MPAFPVAALVVADPLLSTALARDDRRHALRAQVSTQPIGVVAFVGAQAADPAGRLGQHGRSGGDIAGVAGCQQEDAGPAEDIGERMDLGRLAPTGRADPLRLCPPLPP